MESPSKSSSRGLASIAIPLALFALTFVATTFVLRGTLPSAEGELLLRKLELFEEQEPFDVVFIGSSRVYHGLRPEVFDQRMKERGYPVRSFNMAVTGQKVDGAYSALRSLQAREPQALKYVFVDTERVNLMLTDVRRSLRGLIPLHDVESSELLLTYVWGSELSFWEKGQRTRSILRACAYEVTNVGLGLGWIDDLLDRRLSPQELDFRTGPRGDGWRSKDVEPKPKALKVHQDFVAAPRAWEQRVDHFSRTNQASEPLHPDALPLITRIAEVVEEMKAEPIFFTSPAPYPQGQIVNAHKQGHIDTLFQFNDPRQYPELYAMEARWEASHLSAEGATRFSIAIADLFADRLDAQRDQ